LTKKLLGVCNALIPQVWGRFGDVQMRGGDTLTYEC